MVLSWLGVLVGRVRFVGWGSRRVDWLERGGVTLTERALAAVAGGEVPGRGLPGRVLDAVDRWRRGVDEHYRPLVVVEADPLYGLRRSPLVVPEGLWLPGDPV